MIVFIKTNEVFVGRSSGRFIISESYGESIAFDISEETWKKLEFRSEKNSDEMASLREKLSEVCYNYQDFFDFERCASHTRDIRAELGEFREQISGFLKFSTKGVLNGKPVSREFRSLFGDLSFRHALNIKIGRTKSRRRRRIILDDDSIREFGISLYKISVEFERALLEYEEYGFKTGDAVTGWLSSMKVVAKSGGVKVSAKRSDKSPSSFSEFLFDVLKALHGGRASPVSSPLAIAKRLESLKPRPNLRS